MQVNAAILTNKESFKDNDIKKHITRFSKKDRKRVNDSFDELTAILESGQDIPRKFKPHKLSKTVWEIHLVSRGSDVLVKFEWYQENGQTHINFLECTNHAKLRARLVALLSANLLIDYSELTEIKELYKRLYG